ncbi:MAG TPA: DUF393 domain-containing protein [Roseiflexaceae bacterium]|nr:DUF393 domain-containing protein [Roseiflexaceae bacterium]
MEQLTVLYDARCELCRRIKAWLEGQPAYVRLDFVAAGSEEARRRFPDLDHAAALAELTVVSDAGDVYAGAQGWLMCLWALRGYRAWALRLGTPALMPQARRVITWVSQNRWRFGARELPTCEAEGDNVCRIVTNGTHTSD